MFIKHAPDGLPPSASPSCIETCQCLWCQLPNGQMDHLGPEVLRILWTWLRKTTPVLVCMLELWKDWGSCPSKDIHQWEHQKGAWEQGKTYVSQQCTQTKREGGRKSPSLRSSEWKHSQNVVHQRNLDCSEDNRCAVTSQQSIHSWLSKSKILLSKLPYISVILADKKQSNCTSSVARRRICFPCGRDILQAGKKSFKKLLSLVQKFENTL